jgi:hypothetical protein
MEMIAMLGGLQPELTKAQAAGFRGCDTCGSNGMGAVPRSGAYYAAQANRGSFHSGQWEGMSVSERVGIQRAALTGRGPITPEQAMLMAKNGTVSSRQYSANLAAAPMPVRDYEMAIRTNTIASGSYRAQSVIGNPLNTVTLGGSPMTPAAAARMARSGQFSSGQWQGTLMGLGAEPEDKKMGTVPALLIGLAIGAVIYRTVVAE